MDNWKNTYELGGHIHTIILSKLPFDPPMDPYFLARTIGLSNNFELYSEPLVILRVNALIGYFTSYGIT
jgi:hypothetical protein